MICELFNGFSLTKGAVGFLGGSGGGFRGGSGGGFSEFCVILQSCQQ